MSATRYCSNRARVLSDSEPRCSVANVILRLHPTMLPDRPTLIDCHALLYVVQVRHPLFLPWYRLAPDTGCSTPCRRIVDVRDTIGTLRRPHTTNSIRLALATVLGSSRSNRIERYPSIGRQICSSSRYDRHSSCSWSAVESASSRTCVERPPSSISNRYEQPIPINYRSFSLSL